MNPSPTASAAYASTLVDRPSDRLKCRLKYWEIPWNAETNRWILLHKILSHFRLKLILQAVTKRKPFSAASLCKYRWTWRIMRIHFRANWNEFPVIDVFRANVSSAMSLRKQAIHFSKWLWNQVSQIMFASSITYYLLSMKCDSGAEIRLGFGGAFNSNSFCERVDAVRVLDCKHYRVCVINMSIRWKATRTWNGRIFNLYYSLHWAWFIDVL